MLTNFTYFRPKSLPEAIKLLSANNARIHAGGTDLLGCMRDHVFSVDRVISIGKLDELRGIKETNGGLRIGSLTTIAEVAENNIIKKRYPVLAQAAASVASPQLRNQGTVGGNLCQKPRCWYYRGEFHCLRKGGDRCYAEMGENQFHCVFGGEGCFIVHPSDLAPALLALQATVEVVGPKGTQTVALDKFHVPPGQDVLKETILAPDEIVTEILIPPVKDGSKSCYRKVQSRRSWDFAIAGMALVFQFDGDKVVQARVVLSGAAPIPWRSGEVEEAVTGRKLNSDTIAKAVDAVMRKARPLEKNGYKIPMFRGIMEEQLGALA